MFVLACTTSTSRGWSVCVTSPPVPNPAKLVSDLAASVPMMYCAPSTPVRSPTRFSETPTLTTRLRRLAVSTLDDTRFRTSLRASLRSPHVHMSETVDAISDTPGSKNLAAILPTSTGLELAWACNTFLAKTNVIVETTVKISCDHHENHDEARSAWDVRSISGSSSCPSAAIPSLADRWIRVLILDDVKRGVSCCCRVVANLLIGGCTSEVVTKDLTPSPNSNTDSSTGSRFAIIVCRCPLRLWSTVDVPRFVSC